MPHTHRQSANFRWWLGVLAGLVTLVVVTVVLFYLMAFTVGRLLVELGWLQQQQPPGQNPPVMYFVIRFVQIIVMVGVSGYAGSWVLQSGNVVAAGLALSLDKPLEWAVGFFFGNVKLIVIKPLAQDRVSKRLATSINKAPGNKPGALFCA